MLDMKGVNEDDRILYEVAKVKTKAKAWHCRSFTAAPFGAKGQGYHFHSNLEPKNIQTLG